MGCRQAEQNAGLVVRGESDLLIATYFRLSPIRYKQARLPMTLRKRQTIEKRAGVSCWYRYQMLM